MMARLRREDGMTLMELVVAMALGVIVTGALFALSETALKLTVRAGDQVDSNERARTALERIVTLLHSSCVVASVAPIQAGSTHTALYFVGEQTGATTGSSPDSAPILTPYEYGIVFNSSNHTLVESAYPLTGSYTLSDPTTWNFSSTPVAGSTVTLLTNVYQSSNPVASQPVFGYYAYNSSGELPLLQSTGGNAQPVPYNSANYYIPDGFSTLTATQAASIAAVSINFVVDPTDGTAGTNVVNGGVTGATGTFGDRTVSVTDSVVLRFTTASSTVVNDVPCQ